MLLVEAQIADSLSQVLLRTLQSLPVRPPPETAFQTSFHMPSSVAGGAISHEVSLRPSHWKEENLKVSRNSARVVSYYFSMTTQSSPKSQFCDIKCVSSEYHRSLLCWTQHQTSEQSRGYLIFLRSVPIYVIGTTY